MDILTDIEKDALARQIALDRWLQTENYGGDWNDIFYAGWDAAADYYAQGQIQQPKDANRP